MKGLAEELQTLSDEFLRIHRPNKKLRGQYPESLQKLERLQEQKYNQSSAKRRLRKRLRIEQMTAKDGHYMPIKKLKLMDIKECENENVKK